MENPSPPRIVVIGLGYVGLPLAVALARHFPVTGLDIDARRVAELQAGHDRTGEIEAAELAASSLTLTDRPADCRGQDVYIVTVPTPIDADRNPDLGPVIGATRTVAGLIDAAQQPIIVYESTVYPGVTEDLCGPLIEEVSGLRRGTDFFLGYSPERINPGDREHRVENIVKVVAGENPAITDRLADIYGAPITAGIFKAASIKAAEAAKVIENAQRDINIAFMNEVARIFRKVDVSVWDVLDAAGTKWNFLPFQPGLVGGHCIGVDPYYLSHLAERLGHDPKVILAGRTTNDDMGDWIADDIAGQHRGTGRRALVMGITFKENVPDIRNSKVIDVIAGLQQRGYEVTLHDPMADADDVTHEYGLTPDQAALDGSYDVVVCAVPHQAYRDMDVAGIKRLVGPDGLLADIKGIWRGADFGDVARWSL